MKNRTNWIANDGYSTKIFMKGDDMELEKLAKPKDSLIDIMNRRFDSMFEELKELKKETNKIDSINKSLDKTNKKLDSIDNRLNLLENKVDNVIKINNLKV